jgi:phage terminase large subunit-like protein
VDALPAEFIKEVRAWDLAASENEGDWTAGPRMLKTKENMIYIVDMVRGRWGTDGVENTIIQTAQMDGKSVSIRLHDKILVKQVNPS